jgi:hypothetical protein
MGIDRDFRTPTSVAARRRLAAPDVRQGLPLGEEPGQARAASIAKRLSEMGFSLVATKARRRARQGMDVETVHKWRKVIGPMSST